MMSWKRTLRTASSERFLLQRDGQDAAAVDLHYLANGTHVAADPDYSIGGSGASEYRSYFVFDLPALGTVNIASLTYKTFGVTGLGNLVLSEVTTPAATLIADQSGATGVAIFSGLGTGGYYGAEGTVSPSHNNTTRTLGIGAALNEINAGLGSPFVIGINGNGVTYFTGATGSLADNVQLNLTYVPEPASLGLMGFAMFGLIRRRR